MIFSLVSPKKSFLFNTSVVILILFAGLLLNSCQAKDNSLSFMSSVGTVDTLIKNGETGEAVALLKKTEKYAYSSFAKIGLYRRYMILGEKKLAEDVLVKGLKKIPDNLELSAVYGQFLLRTGRVSDAVKVTEVLSGTKYGSIHSEAVLKNIFKNDSEIFNRSYVEDSFKTVYQDIYNSTKDSRWLRNATLIQLAKGNYADAAALQSGNFASSDDAFFWAIVQFDAENYELCMTDLYHVQDAKYGAQVASLSSDSLMKIGEPVNAAKAREEFLSGAESKGLDIPPMIAVNSAIAAYKTEKYQRAYDLLMDTMKKDPENTPALITYSMFAWEDAQPVKIQPLEQTVREETTLRTARMQAFDERPRFLVSDALYRMESCIAAQKKAGKPTDDDLQMERLSLFLKSNSDMPLKARIAEIWKELEVNEKGVNLYPSRLVQFAVQKFLFFGMVDDARTLFTNFITAKYLNYSILNSKKTKNSKLVEEGVYYDIFGGERKVALKDIPDNVIRSAFGEKVAETVTALEVWEVEMAAYFALLDGNHEVARTLYEYVVFKSGGTVNDLKRGKFGAISPLAATSSAANLAMIYSSLGEKQRALDLYGLASGKEKESKLKAKILYRVAKLQMGFGDTKQANLSLDYCLALDPQNAEARLLKREIDK